jgi:hypothetical protein
MSLPQVLHQQLGGPNRGVITQFAGVLSEGRVDQGVDDPGERRRAARARSVEEAVSEVEAFSSEEAVDPVVDGLTADLERFGDLLGGETLGEPEHRLGATPLLGAGGMEHEVFELPTQVIAQDDPSHRTTPRTGGVTMVDSPGQGAFCQAGTRVSEGHDAEGLENKPKMRPLSNQAVPRTTSPRDGTLVSGVRALETPRIPGILRTKRGLRTDGLSKNFLPPT